MFVLGYFHIFSLFYNVDPRKLTNREIMEVNVGIKK